MSGERKLIQKLKRREKLVKNKAGGFDRHNKIFKNDEVLAGSERALELMRSKLAKLSRQFGNAFLGSDKSEVIERGEISSLVRTDFGGSDFGLKCIMLGTNEATDIAAVADLSAPEITQITAIADTGVLESTDITAVADTGVLESSDITTVSDTGAKEAFTAVAITDTGVLEHVVVNVPATAAATQADYFMLTNTTGAKVACWLDIDAANTPPTGADYVSADSKIKISIITGGTAIQNAAILASAVGSIQDWVSTDNLDGTVSFDQTLMGDASEVRHNADDTGVGSFSFSGLINGAASNLNSTFFTFKDALDAHSYYVWYNVNSEGVDPMAAGTAIPVVLAAGALDTAVGSASRAQITSVAGANVVVTGSGANITVTNKLMGASTDAADGAAPTGFTIGVDAQGASSNLNSSYFTFNSALDATAWNVWFNVNGEGVDPMAAGTAIPVTLAAGASDITVGGAIRAALVAAAADITITGSNNHAIITNKLMGQSTDAANGTASPGFSYSITQGADSNLNGTYFTFNSALDATAYNVWFNVNGEGVDPAAPGTAIPVALAAGALNTAVGGAIRSALTAASADITITGSGAHAIITNKLLGDSTDADDGLAAPGFAYSITQGALSNLASKHFTISKFRNLVNYYVWFTVNGEGSSPALAGKTAIPVALDPSDADTVVATKIKSALDVVATIPWATTRLNEVLTITNNGNGATTDALDGVSTPTTFDIQVTQQGVSSNLNNKYLLLDAADSSRYFVWFNVDSLGSAPSVAGRTAVAVALTGGSSANTVGGAIRSALTGNADFTITGSNQHCIVTNTEDGAASDAANGVASPGFTITVTTQGSGQGTALRMAVGDSLLMLSGALKGRYLQVTSKISENEVRLEDVSSFTSGSSIKFRVAHNSVNKSLV